MTTSIFIGLVTHDSSRFPEARGPHGLTRLLEKELTQQSIVVHAEIHSANHVDDLDLVLSLSDLQRSIAAELKVERDWYHFLNPNAHHTTHDLVLSVRRWLRAAHAYIEGIRNSFALRESRTLERLINIELAHMHLMQSAVTSGADWVLILEDDAHTPDVKSFSSALVGFLAAHKAVDLPKYVNLSQSFDMSTLRIDGLLAPRGQWNAERALLGSSLPVTNTVCAILYRRTFLLDLLDTLIDHPLVPVIPIDWKVNRALMELHSDDRIPDYACWFVDPAPIVQGSMHHQP